MRQWLGYTLVGLLCGTSFGLAACGDDDDGMSETMMDGGTDGGRDGGVDANLPRDGGIDSGNMRDAGNPYQCEPPASAGGTLGAGAACCSGLGTCQARGPDGGTAGVGDCNAQQNLRCVPRASGDAGVDTPDSCRMRISGSGDAGADYEGRCIPECLASGVASLERVTCSQGSLCVPCYSPVTGEDTGACRNNGDAPMDPAPAGFAECGDMLGYCVSSGLAGQGSSTLPQLSCPVGEVCAPKERVLEPDSCFAHCTAIGAAGACVPTFLVPEASRSFLQQDVCLMGELCSPCVNPLDQRRTGACD